MGAIEHGSVPAELQQARSRFQAWRGRRRIGERIPRPLWDLAVRLAKVYGVSRTATALGLDYYSLQKRAGAGAGVAQDRSSAPAFVEITAPAMVTRQCQVELDNGAGATLRMQLVGYDVADIEALTRTFWSAR